jgi:hypothetical protein
MIEADKDFRFVFFASGFVTLSSLGSDFSNHQIESRHR